MKQLAGIDFLQVPYKGSGPILPELIGGVIGAGVLFAVNYFFVRLTYRNRPARLLLEGTPRVLLEHGKPDKRALLRLREKLA